MAKIVTVYKSKMRPYDRRYGSLMVSDASYIRWFKISEALARLGHKVDIATVDFNWWRKRSPVVMGKNLRKVSLDTVKWKDYDVVKTIFHQGFQTLEDRGGAGHPFIISKLGSVVGPEETEGVYFYGKVRRRLYSVQEKINKSSKYITVLTRQSKELWEKCFGVKNNVLLVPGATDSHIPPSSGTPYPQNNTKVCLFAGNVYDNGSQPEAHAVIIGRLNMLGKLLAERGVRLYVMGPGDVRRLDRKYVTCLGIVPYERSWDYMYFAHVGIVLAMGKAPNDNESSKIYHYLRAGLPVVAESGYPNEALITAANLGFIVENGNMELMADKIKEAVDMGWDRDKAIRYIVDNHTWDKRVRIYDDIIKKKFGRN